MPFILLVVGLILVLFEFFSAGGLFATLGGAAIIASVIWSGYATAALLPTLVFIALAAVATWAVIRFGMRQVRSRMRHGDDQEGSRAASLDAGLIGAKGTALTDLRPSGKVEIGGNPYPAVSKEGYVEKGKKIEVIQVQMGHLVVR